MPTYDYRCDACGHTFELFQSMKAEPIKRCPKCGKLKVKRLIGAGAGLIFKGSGFYITDYRDKSYQDKAKADTSSGSPETPKTDAPKTDAPAAGKSDAPAAPKPEVKPAKVESPKASKSAAKGKRG